MPSATGPTPEEVAEKARSRPGVWVAFRRYAATANLVTDLRSGRVVELPPSEFEARAHRLAPRPDAGKAAGYAIEVRMAPVPEVDVERAVTGALFIVKLDQILAPALMRRLTDALQSRVAHELREAGVTPR